MSSTAATYMIAQHVADLFRREPRNIGVFVRLEDQIEARFFGVKDDGTIDGRKTRVLPAPGVYAHWIRHWRRTVAIGGQKAWDALRETAKAHYPVIDGGTVDRIGPDSAADVAAHLYAVLVSEGGMSGALGGIDEAEAALRLADDVEDAMKQAQIFDEGPNLFRKAKHPVRRDVPVKGKTTNHLLRFVQRSTHTVAMEPIDLAVRRDRRRMYERAGWASRVFEDIRQKDKKAETVAIVSATPEQAKDESARYALTLLKPYARIVNWQDGEQRKKFIGELSHLAVAG